MCTTFYHTFAFAYLCSGYIQFNHKPFSAIPCNDIIACFFCILGFQHSKWRTICVQLCSFQRHNFNPRKSITKPRYGWHQDQFHFHAQMNNSTSFWEECSLDRNKMTEFRSYWFAQMNNTTFWQFLRCFLLIFCPAIRLFNLIGNQTQWINKWKLSKKIEQKRKKEVIK